MCLAIEKVCRRCGATNETARFAPIAVNRCARCQAIEKAERAGRRAARTVPAAAGVTGWRVRNGESGAHLAWIRSLPCRLGRPECGQITHAHHVRSGTGGGTGMKPADRWAVPLCPRHHAEGHAMGWVTFELRYGIDLRRVAEALACGSPYLHDE